MNTTAHPVAPDEVMAFLDGELSTVKAQAISTHVETCPECTALAGQYKRTSQLLSRWNVETVPAKLQKSILDAAAKTGSGLRIGKSSLFTRASFWTWKQWAAASAGTLAALLLVSTIFLSASQRSQPHALILADPGDFIQQKSEPSQGRNTTGLGTLTQRGIAADSKGLFHGLGDHAANSLSAGGQTIADQQSKIASAPMIARTVSLSIVVKDFAVSRSALDGILTRHRGYSAQLSVSTPENAPRGLQASLRIPASQLSSAVAEIRTLGRVENESQSGEEVTQQHTDLVARLKNSAETEQRLRTILEQRTGKVVEVLQVEQEIARVRGDIESMQAVREALEHRVDFAAVELQLTEEYKAQLNPPAPSVSTRIHNAFVAGYRDASETLLGILLFLAEYVPTLLIWLLIFALPGIFLRRRFRKALVTV